ncbi:MAG: hypothetical protein U0234_00530 [Sandaracinus sp.]
MFDRLPATRRMAPVSLTVRDATGATVFNGDWTASADLGTLDVVRRGYLASDAVRVDGRLTLPVRTLLDRIADFVLSLDASEGA